MRPSIVSYGTDEAQRLAVPDRDSDRRRTARYVAIVADGSARWAQARGLPIERGYDAAVDTAIARVADATELGIAELTLYAFSTENWARSEAEVRAVLGTLANRIASGAPKLHSRRVRIRSRPLEAAQP